MDKPVYIYMLIEGVIFLLPLASLFFKIGGWQKHIEEQISQIWKELGRIDSESETLHGAFTDLNTQLQVISSKLDLLIEGKLKNG